MPNASSHLSFRYRLLSTILFLPWCLHALWCAYKYKQPSYFWQRLGFLGILEKKIIWLHASSIGEIDAINPLVTKLLDRHSVLVTTFTATGYQHARRLLPAAAVVRSIPIDFWPLSFHFVHQMDCKLALIIETELWPETLFQLDKHKTPLLQVNARISRKSLNAHSFFKSILSDTLGYFDSHLTRSKTDAKNLIALGANPDNIKVIGNLKFAEAEETTDYQDIIKMPYILLASTHHPEEKELVQTCINSGYDGLIVIVPRHPKRAEKIISELSSAGLSIAQRSKNELIDSDTKIYLADTLGELEALIQYSTLVIMGGSFIQYGGHNVLQPARLGKTTLTGPSDYDFKEEVALLLKHNAIIQVRDKSELEQQLRKLLNHPEAAKEVGINAKRVFSLQSEILQQYVSAIESSLELR